MTTTVKVEAHCDANSTEVQVVQSDGATTVLQDGETHELHVHDDREVTVREVRKGNDTQLSEECPD